MGNEILNKSSKEINNNTSDNENKYENSYIDKLKKSIESRDKKIAELELELSLIKASKQSGFDEDKKIWKYNLHLMQVLKTAIKSAKKVENEANDLIKSVYILKEEWTKDINKEINKPIQKIVKQSLKNSK